MQVVYAKNISRQQLINADSIIIRNKASLMDTGIVEKIMNLSNKDCLGLTRLLNKINKQGIKDINAREFSFQVEDMDTSINLNSLSSGEKVFVLAFIAYKYNMSLLIWVSYLSMGRDDLKLFIELFDKVVQIQFILIGDFTEAFWRCKYVEFISVKVCKW